MNKKLFKIASLSLAVVLLSGLAGCSKTQETASATQSSQTQVTTLSSETSATTQESTPTTLIALKDGAVTVEGSGVEVNGSMITITEGGVYSLQGTLSDGQIIVNAPKTTTVELQLNGVDITNSTSSAVYAVQANQIIVTLVKGTKNVLTDASEYVYAEEKTDEPDAALFSDIDLQLQGTGTLEINANFNNGIGTKDDLVITSGNYTISAKNHALRGRDSVTITDGTFNLTAGNDGIQSNNDEDVSKGSIKLDGGEYNIISGHDAIQSETSLDITGGTFTILAGNGSAGTITNNEATIASDSYKGIKAGTNLTLSGGTVTVDSADDALHANNIAISNANIILSSGDDGIHADGDLNISSGSVAVKTSYEGIEGSNINILGGEISITSSDDGINVAGGTDSSETTIETEPRFGGDTFLSNSNRKLTISGGTTTINASGDGIDINGSGKMTGGYVFVDGPVDDRNASLDYDGSFDISGGTLVAAGSSGMAMATSETSTQLSILVYFSAQKEAETKITILNSSGAEVVSYSPSKTFQSIVLSDSALALGETYIVTEDDNELFSITLSAVNTSVSDTGEAATGRMGGGPGDGGPGGERPAEPPQNS